MRLNKFIADSGITSRRKADELISQGRVTIDGNVVVELGTKVMPDKQKIEVDGETINRQRNVYYLLNKPEGYVSTVQDEKGRPTVIQLLKTGARIYPVGRLDYNTTGVLLLTNDGEFTNAVTHPSNMVPREYKVHISRPLEDEHKELFLKGIMLEDGKGKFHEIELLAKNRKIVRVLCFEGRNHFVKNMFNTLGYNVDRLERLRLGSITVGDLARGAYRRLTDDEIASLSK